jgi:hypothetical protein
MIVAGWPKGNGTNGSRSQTVVVFLMNLRIGAKLDSAMLGEVNPMSKDNIAWAERSRYSVLMGESI